MLHGSAFMFTDVDETLTLIDDLHVSWYYHIWSRRAHGAYCRPKESEYVDMRCICYTNMEYFNKVYKGLIAAPILYATYLHV